MEIVRRHQATKVKDKCATKSIDILSGMELVAKLEESDDAIGEMNDVCGHCGALKFKRETGSVCCLNGKIGLPAYPKPPAPIMDLLLGQDAKSRIFRQHARLFNNAVCLSSISVKERVQGYTPTVIFMGKVTHLAGSIAHQEGEKPVFCQLYVLDESLETTVR